MNEIKKTTPENSEEEQSSKEKNGEEQKDAQSEEIKRLKEENERLLADNVNYKQAITKKNVSDFELGDEEEETGEKVEKKPEISDDDETWQQVEKRAREISEKTYKELSRKDIKSNEEAAKKRIFAENPELLNNQAMQSDVRELYVNRSGKSVDGIIADLQDAVNLYKVKNGISLEKKEETPADVNIPSMPTGESSLSETPDEAKLSDSDKKCMDDFKELTGMDIKPETFGAYKKAVLEGKRSAPSEVINLFKSG